MRFRDEKPGDLARARAAVAEWRAANPAGAPEQLIGAVGPVFPPEWGIVLRAMLFAADRHQARTITGVITSPAEGAR
jgi:hypothetical protein